VKVLFFRAAAEHPGAAPALQAQTHSSLRPFDQFLRQAARTAKQRQFRYKLPWKRVRDQRVLELDARDTRLVIPRRAPGWVITNWPPGKVPEMGRPLLVISRDASIRVESCDPGPNGPVIRTVEPLRSDDEVIWCQVPCTLAPAGVDARPREVRDATGKSFPVLQVREHDERTWELRVEGRPGEGALVVDGFEVDADRLGDLEGVQRLYEEGGASFELSGGQLKVEELPATNELQADTGVRFRWRDRGAGGRTGLWIQLLPPTELDADAFLDPRAAFCEDEVKEVWTQPRHRAGDVLKVKRVDRERYQLLLSELPPAGSELHLPVDVRNLELQRRALRQLLEAPLPHHRGLLRLCQSPSDAHWPVFSPSTPAAWSFLRNVERSGTDQQRGFVEQALGSPDLALLEGPPGSGKTTAICELIRQCLDRNERVLLCASTHVAIDNVLERLIEHAAPIDAVRIGAPGKVDQNVQECQIDARVDALVEGFRAAPWFRRLGDQELREMAERTVIMAANLTCGTTMGIVNHPLFRGRDRDLDSWDRPISTMPHWDVLIIDEASKTTIQEFMVPALMARRWVVVGDVWQLPPFTDRADIVANLRSLADANEREVFPPDQQRARVLLFRLLRGDASQEGVRWLIVEPPGVLAAIEQALGASAASLTAVRIATRTGPGSRLPVVTVAQLRAGDTRSLWLAAADWVLVPTELLADVAAYLPANLLAARDLTSGDGALAEGHALLFRIEATQARSGALPRWFRERGDSIGTFAELAEHERAWLARHDWAGELAWRITRVHELKRSRGAGERERLRADIRRLVPAAAVAERVDEIQDIGLPSILEVIQEGIGQERTQRPSALTEGLPRRHKDAFEARFQSLSYQHRMHAEISGFAREAFYKGEALHDANTIAHRDAELGWDFAPALSSRRVWLNVEGRESGGVNQREIDAMASVVRSFLAWVQQKGPPRRDLPRAWELACLCFYVKQEAAMRTMLRELTGQREQETRFRLPGLEIVCGVVDRFQGREADVVVLSMRNTGRTGFLDSPNRLNVAVTRARQQLVVIGRAAYFSRCAVPELEDLVKKTRVEEPRVWPGPAGAPAPRRGPGVRENTGRDR
jgi:DNA polymerase III delta prime subunit